MSTGRNIPFYRPENFYGEEPFFQKLIRHYLSPEEFTWAEAYLAEMGKLSAQKLSPLALESDHHRPELLHFDPTGARIDEIQYHDSYRTLAKWTYEFGIVGLGHSKKFKSEGRFYGPILKFALGYLFSQSGSVLYCPICMTDGTLQILERHGSEELKQKWIPALSSMEFETFRDGAMYLTEAQGGSDVGANTCRAFKKDGDWRLSGEKWFCSNIGSDTALVLARPEGAPEGTTGLGLFLVPKILANGERNKIQVNRLKPKLGTCEMGTAEVEFVGALAYPVGEINEGFSYMAQMINLSRTYNAIWSIGLMRRASLEAHHYAAHREAFGKTIASFPLVAQTLSWMEADAQKCTALVFETLKYLDRLERGTGGPEDETLCRILTPVIKFYTAEKAIEASHRAIEIFGGNGCIEDFPVAKLLRDSQILAIWEGTANILSLDVLRTMKKHKAHEVLLETTRKEIEDLPNPEAKERLMGPWQELKNKFFRVKKGEDGVGGELECRELAAQIARFIPQLVLNRIQGAGKPG